jgi:hypothetical protein
VDREGISSRARIATLGHSKLKGCQSSADTSGAKCIGLYHSSLAAGGAEGAVLTPFSVAVEGALRSSTPENAAEAALKQLLELSSFLKKSEGTSELESDSEGGLGKMFSF